MKPIVTLIVKYLKGELESNLLSPEAAEGVEVALQCLENAYGVTSADIEQCTLSLEALYSSSSHTAQEGRVATEEEKEEADSLKLIGNRLMKDGSFMEAISHYNRAISIDPNNAVYFCNRAAAQIQLKNYPVAINDCLESIRLDHKYSKAHSRLGYAYQAVGNTTKARESYARAHELEPENESYRNSLLRLEDQGPSSSQPVSELMGLLPGIDLTSIMRSPSFVHMAAQMLEDPEMRSAVARILTGQTSFPMGQVQELISAGQELADRLQGTVDNEQAPEGSSVQQPPPPNEEIVEAVHQNVGVEGEEEHGALAHAPHRVDNIQVPAAPAAVPRQDIHEPAVPERVPEPNGVEHVLGEPVELVNPENVHALADPVEENLVELENIPPALLEIDQVAPIVINPYNDVIARNASLMGAGGDSGLILEPLDPAAGLDFDEAGDGPH